MLSTASSFPPLFFSVWSVIEFTLTPLPNIKVHCNITHKSWLKIFLVYKCKRILIKERKKHFWFYKPSILFSCFTNFHAHKIFLKTAVCNLQNVFIPHTSFSKFSASSSHFSFTNVFCLWDAENIDRYRKIWTDTGKPSGSRRK